MKTTTFAAACAALLLTCAAPALAQQSIPVTKDSGAAHAHSNEHMSGWHALDAYHMVMMRAWHPAKEQKNLAPARAAADSLAARADAWASSPVPAACDMPAARAQVAQVRDDSRAFAALVRQGTADEPLLAALRGLHDRFEIVNRGCRAH